MTVSQKDREILRSLAARYMTYALSDKNNEKRNERNTRQRNFIRSCHNY